MYEKKLISGWTGLNSFDLIQFDINIKMHLDTQLQICRNNNLREQNIPFFYRMLDSLIEEPFAWTL